MWPFADRLREKNALEKYRRWLRRWLLDGHREPVPDKFSRFPKGLFQDQFCE
ncbi:MAG: hypothetical protein FWC60_04840 [Firmicutes bacterium]|nr:hypothetical protein [Bacillota bacterium]